MPPNDLLTGLPGEELVRQGLVDMQADRCTIPACLVAIGLPRMRRAGLVRQEPSALPAEAELQLYRMLRQAGGDAFSHYNALLRQLVSFEQALDRRCRNRQRREERLLSGPATAPQTKNLTTI
ncbi:MAG: hypothetical protein ABSH34_02175 [Verrucomicrobiota bacterium]|jgi:hypothetical protein